MVFMKIGFDAKRIFHNRTGLGNYSRDLVRILASFFPKNDYFLYNPKQGENIYFIPSNDNVREVLPNSVLSRFFHNLWRQFTIIEDLKKDRIQIFHGLTGEIPYGLKKAGIKSVVTVHDLIFMRYPQFYSFFDRNIHRLKARYAVKNADVVVAVSQQTKDDILAFFNIDPEKVQVIYQGCHDVFKESLSLTDKERVKKKFNLPEKFILNVGTIEERKNILTGVKAIKDMDTHLVIVGSETSYFKEVKNFINENNLGSKVTFLKGVSTQELAMLYQSATMFIYPSLFEGFGIPIVEALFSGTPVISSKGGCFAEAGGPFSIYVDPRSPEDLRDAIELVLNNETKRAQMIQQGFLYAERFTPAYIANSFAEVYDGLKAI
jgi:glycosyltransferase involved in cell wall biosynthesis